jgi:hypothetical protein
MIRINNIEFKKYNSTKTKKPLYEIIKWESNPYFGKEQEYRDDGYVDSFGGDFLQKHGHNIQKTFFNRKETCFVIAFIEKGSESWELRSVGQILLDLTPEEWDDFHQVYTLGQAKLNKNEKTNISKSI